MFSVWIRQYFLVQLHKNFGSVVQDWGAVKVSMLLGDVIYFFLTKVWCTFIDLEFMCLKINGTKSNWVCSKIASPWYPFWNFKIVFINIRKEGRLCTSAFVNLQFELGLKVLFCACDQKCVYVNLHCTSVQASKKMTFFI